jgi:regulator of RNase E activity RraB
MELRSLGETKPPYDRDDLEVLDTFEVNSPGEGDRKVIEQLLASGADLNKPRHTIHFLYFPSSKVADEASEALRQAGYNANTCEQSEIPSQNSWPVLADKTGLVNQSAMERERVFLDALAESFSGEYDGWETSLD